MNNRQSSKKERIGWYLYDWANSAFYTTVITVFFGPYLKTISENAAKAIGPENKYIDVLGFGVYYESFFEYTLSFSVILQVIVLPALGAIADRTQKKKIILLIFAYLGAFSTMGLFFVEGTAYLLGGALFAIANLSFGSAVVMYNAYLNEIAAPGDRNKVSSIGWAVGYLGGGLLLALNLVFYSMRDSLGIETGLAVRICLASAGAWWALFTIFPALWLKVRKSLVVNTQLKASGFRELIRTIREAKKYPRTFLFLASYLLYNDGIQAVIGLTAVFAIRELKFEQEFLIQVILLVQFVAFGGALIFNRAAEKINTKRALLISLILWAGVVFYAYAFLPEQAKVQFLILSVVIGIILGGAQALSRSLYSLFIPVGKEAQYYSLYEISERGTSWMGPFIFGLALQETASYRIAVLSLGIFFILGFILLNFVNVKKTIQDSGNAIPERV